MSITIWIPGKPVPQGRPRFTVRHGKVVAYDPPTSKKWKKEAAEIIKDRCEAEGWVPNDLPVQIAIRIFISTKNAALSGAPYIKKSGDIDNFAKAALDAGNGYLYDDDSRVWSLRVTKEYAWRPVAGVEISVNREE